MVNDLIEKIIANFDLLDYMQRCGFTPYRIGSCYGLKEHGSVRIFPDRAEYFHPGRGISKPLNVINFAEWYYGISNRDAIKMFAAELNDIPLTRRKSYTSVKNNVIDKQEPVSLKLPEAAKEQYKHVFAYLNKERCIDKSIISDLMKRKMLYQDQNRNATFVSYKDGEPCFCFQRGTSTARPYKHIVKGSDFEQGWYVDNKSSKLFVTEAIIDDMSIMSMLKMHGIDPNNYNYLATGGTSMKAVVNHVINNPNIKTVYLAFDNDAAGDKYRQRARQDLISKGYEGRIIDKPPVSKDFNLDLQTQQAVINDTQQNIKQYIGRN